MIGFFKGTCAVGREGGREGERESGYRGGVEGGEGTVDLTSALQLSLPQGALPRLMAGGDDLSLK